MSLSLSPLRAVFDVGGLVHELNRAPELWDDFPLRTREEFSPHHGLSDIWVRYNAQKHFDGDRAQFMEPHLAEWWKAAAHLPSARRLAFELMHAVDGEHLGMVLITRIPPRTNCLPHKDGGWHAQFYDKYAIQVKSARGQAFCFEDVRHECGPGGAYQFDNARLHWVENDTDSERITMIVCIRNRFTGVATCL